MPETPTKAGFYYWRIRTWKTWGVANCGPEITGNVREYFDSPDAEWGERLPDDPATLAALRELAAKDPLIDDDWGGGFPFCHYCGGVECGDGPDPDVPPYRIHHHADCPYPKAQEKRDE